MIDFSLPLSDFVRAAPPLVSAIVPSYNKAEYLAESVGSILAQTYKNIEIVIVNDGSTDSTAEVARNLQRDNPTRTFLLLDKPNGGISSARNYAIERCTGRIVCCLDGDDIAEPTFIEKGLAAMRDLNANLVCCDVTLFGAETGDWAPQPYEIYALRYNNCIPTLVMYDKTLWAKAGGYSVAFPFNEDWEFFIRCSQVNLAVHKIPEKLFRYRVTTSGLAQSYIKDSWEQSVGLMMTCNSDLYPVEHVLAAHKNLSAMRNEWRLRFEKQRELYPTNWLLPFWIGLAAEGQNQIQQSFDNYITANQAAGGNSWQIIFRLGSLLEKENPLQAAQLFHGVRVLRPDMNRYLEDRIKQLSTK